ncbi:MAG: RNA-binding domain-containing protein [Dermatophilaceae bacterium]
MTRSDEELRRMLADLESEQVERKESLTSSTKDRVYQAVCAFANDLPGRRSSGVVFIGVRDDGQPSGLTITDNLLLDLASMRDQGKLLPPPTMSVRTLSVGEHAVAVVEIEPSLSPPVRFDGRVWIRVGPRRALATGDEERRLAERRRSLDLPFDSTPLPGAELSDLDLDLFTRAYLPAVLPAEILAANGRTDSERLASLSLATTDDVPTVAGALILGREPSRHVPGAYVQFLRVDGRDLAEPVIDEKRLDAPVPDLLRELDELLKLNIRTSVDIGTGLRDARASDYPLAALQQVCRNAILHRTYEATSAPVRISWYSDRVEVVSPGGPYGVVNVENFGRPGVTDYRNRVIAEAMAALGYVQRFGAGLEIMRRSLEDNGNPAAELVADPSYVAVVIRRRQ